MSIRRSARLGAKATPASTLDGLANLPSTRQPMSSNVHCAVSTEEEEDGYQSKSEDEYQMEPEYEPSEDENAEVPKKVGRSMRTTRGDSKPSKKRQASRTPAARSRIQGRLKDIMSMPLDILFEICFHLVSADLVPLARTSKFLWEVLMDRRHAFIWKTARLNVPGVVPPDPPIGMSEPAWARLLYGGSGCYDPIWQRSIEDPNEALPY
ncbi:hypothetical protein PENSPDRAFT_760268 [Peniophora sp. CONT]|nr:hypothetical protein PENSPDRAFT_760268 [Peniophora sp. CONT]